MRQTRTHCMRDIAMSSYSTHEIKFLIFLRESLIMIIERRRRRQSAPCCEVVRPLADIVLSYSATVGSDCRRAHAHRTSSCRFRLRKPFPVGRRSRPVNSLLCDKATECRRTAPSAGRVSLLELYWYRDTALPAQLLKVKVKALPYSIPSVEPGADPDVEADSPQVTVSHPPGGRLPLLSASPAVTSPAAEHHHRLAGTKLYCLVTEAHRCKQLSQGVT